MSALSYLAMSVGSGWLWFLVVFSLLACGVADAVEKVAKNEGVKNAAKDGFTELLRRWLR